MEAIAGLLPESLWRYFRKISQIPRESGNEERIREYLISTARRCNLEYRIDAAGNVLVIKPGTAGSDTVILQSHMDMVCEKNMETVHDFATDPIRLVRDGEWINADGTTLGADNGIGMAAMLAIMEDTSLAHPDLELLFTIEEETGLTGASMLTEEFISGRTLINLDSEEDGTFYIGCAGGRNTDIMLTISLSDPPDGLVPVMIKITGLKGGHSGIDIHKGRGNAIKLLNRFLKGVQKSIPFYLAAIEGGTKHNAIPREAQAVVCIKEQSIAALRDAASRWAATFSREMEGIDDQVRLEVLQSSTAQEKVIVPEDTEKIFTMLSILPHGALSMNASMDNLVITSTNLAICRVKGGALELATNQRSIYTTSILDSSDMVKSIGWVMGAKVAQSEDYPAWKPDPDSTILKRAKAAYLALYGTAPRVKIIHAGLECGVIGERISGIDMISLGPTVEHAHSPSEKVNIETVGKMWKFLTILLEDLTSRQGQ